LWRVPGNGGKKGEGKNVSKKKALKKNRGPPIHRKAIPQQSSQPDTPLNES